MNLSASGAEADSVEYNQSCKAKNARILGLEWTAVNEVLFLTDHGLELYQVQPERRAVRNLRVQNFSANWFAYCVRNSVHLHCF